MSVVNVRVAQLRPQYDNLKEWMSVSDHVYIGRKGIVFVDGQRFPPYNSWFFNPYKIGKDGTREEVLWKYEHWYIRPQLGNPGAKEAILDLRGKILGCWCAPEPCHGDILLRLIEEVYHSSEQ